MAPAGRTLGGATQWFCDQPAFQHADAIDDGEPVVNGGDRIRERQEPSREIARIQWRSRSYSAMVVHHAGTTRRSCRATRKGIRCAVAPTSIGVQQRIHISQDIFDPLGQACVGHVLHKLRAKIVAAATLLENPDFYRIDRQYAGKQQHHQHYQQGRSLLVHSHRKFVDRLHVTPLPNEHRLRFHKSSFRSIRTKRRSTKSTHRQRSSY